MLRALTKLLPEDRPSTEKRRYKRRDNNERPKYQNVHVSLSLPAFFFGSVLLIGRAAHGRPDWKVLSFIISFYGNDGTKFPDKVPAKECPGYATSGAAHERPFRVFGSVLKVTVQVTSPALS
jgi:hypothetical protein